MMNFKDEEIKYFINRELICTPKQAIRSGLILLLICGLPTAIFGMHSVISKITMLSIIIALCIWSILLLRNPLVNQNQFNLHFGVLSQFLSVLSLITGFRELSRTTQIPKTEIFMFLSLYLLCIAANLFIVIKLLKNGHYGSPIKPRMFYGFTAMIPVMGILFGRRIFGNVNQGTTSYVMGIFFIVLGLYLTLGTTNYLRYYLGKNIKNSSKKTL